MPKTEVWFVWRELVTPEGETEPRLMIPWSNPYEYEYPAEEIFKTADEAKAWKKEHAAGEEWYLVCMTCAPVELVAAESDAE